MAEPFKNIYNQDFFEVFTEGLFLSVPRAMEYYPKVVFEEK